MIYDQLYTVCLQHYRWSEILLPSQRPLFLKEWRLLTSLDRLQPIKYVRYHPLITATTFVRNRSGQAMAMDVKLTQIHQDEFPFFTSFSQPSSTEACHWTESPFTLIPCERVYWWVSMYEYSMFHLFGVWVCIHICVSTCVCVLVFLCALQHMLACQVSWGQSWWSRLPEREAVALEDWHSVTPLSGSLISHLFDVAAYI